MQQSVIQFILESIYETYTGYIIIKNKNKKKKVWEQVPTVILVS